MAGPDRRFWQQRFERGEIPWDRGISSPQLDAWLAAGALPATGRIVVPGCGSGHEVATLARHGYAVIGLDYAAAAVELTRERLAREGLSAELAQADVLAWQPAEPLAAVYEQTCLCALHPDHWAAYAERLHVWLEPGGTLALLAMQALREGARDGCIEGRPITSTSMPCGRCCRPRAGTGRRRRMRGCRTRRRAGSSWRCCSGAAESACPRQPLLTSAGPAGCPAPTSPCRS